ncbi:hypothetical protein FPRO05_09002 [Fusarium proliferatum]|uniref:Uncharacterized protein n=1 Tax=Gibberella intermedia TaxID=948311 RepID=A0A365NG76_GIBIN|nr:hypothetical protein FPRO05_09002 [Fusarium proliferatum]
MGSTQLVDFTPTDIDMIFAVSQQNLNEGLYDYISGLGAKIDWSFDVDDDGNLAPPTNPSEPDILFSGVLAPPVEPGPGNTPVWIVDLSQAGAANQVTFNVTFADGATFTDNQLKHTYTQSVATGGPQWIIPFQVNLTMADIKDLSNKPTWLQERLAALNGNYDEVCDLSQVLLDLTTLASTTPPKASLPDGIMYYDWTIIVQGTFTYLQAHHGAIYKKPPTAGYSVTYNGGTPIQKPPTFTPTGADLVILPNPTNPGASTLVFIFMIQGREFPTSPANAFVDVTLITDPAITPGVAVIGAPNWVSFIQKDIQSFGLQNKVVTNYVHCWFTVPLRTGISSPPLSHDPCPAF